MNLGTATILRANARDLPLDDNSVDLVVTSPPYFALRSYQDGGEHYAGQIGDEPTPAEFVDSLLEVTRECMRVLKPSGSLWVNLGDKYSGAQQQSSGRESTMTSADYWRRTNPEDHGRQSQVSVRHPVALRPPLHRRPRAHPPRRGDLVEAERAAGERHRPGAAVARTVVPLHAGAALLLGGG